MIFATFESRVKIGYRSVYVCAVCGARQAGEYSRAEFYVYSPDDLQTVASEIRQTSHDMPIGWSFSGQFKCPNCKG